MGKKGKQRTPQPLQNRQFIIVDYSSGYSPFRNPWPGYLQPRNHSVTMRLLGGVSLRLGVGANGSHDGTTAILASPLTCHLRESSPNSRMTFARSFGLVQYNCINFDINLLPRKGERVPLLK